MKFILFSDSEETRKRVLLIFSEAGREIISLKDTELLNSSIEQAYFPVVLIDVKFSHFPAYRISKELKEKFSGKRMKIFLITPEVTQEEQKKILELWHADGVIPVSNIEEKLTKLLIEFPELRRGNFREKPFLSLLLEIKKKSFSGTLIVTKDHDEKAIYFEKGLPKYAITSRREEKIGELLIRRGKITPDALEQFLEEAKSSHSRIGEFLIGKGIITREEMKEILQMQMEEIFQGIFAWDDADYTLTTENIAMYEDVLIERDFDELIYSGIMKYLDVTEHVNIMLFPKLLLSSEEIQSRYPLNERERNLLNLFDGKTTIEELSFKSDCTLKEIQRLCYLLSGTRAIELLSSPFMEEGKAVIGRIQPHEIRLQPVEEEVKEKSEDQFPEQSEEEIVPEKREKEKEKVVEDRSAEERRKAPYKYKFHLNLLLMGLTILIVIFSIIITVVVRNRAENKLLEERISRSSELIKSDLIPALKNATQILSDCMKKKTNAHLIGLYAFSYIRLFELTNNHEYLERAKEIIKAGEEELTRKKGNNDNLDELKALNLLLLMAENDMDNAEKYYKAIGQTQNPIALYSLARYTLESSGDTEGVVKILEPITREDMQAAKLELATAYSFSGNLGKLKILLSDLKREIPAHPDVILLKGDEKFLEGQYKEAETIYKLALESRPGHVQTVLRLGRTYLAMNQPDKVAGEIEPIIGKTDIRTNCGKLARLLYARAQQMLKNFEKSKELFMELTKVYPFDEEIKKDLDSIERSIQKELAVKEKKESLKDLLKKARKLYEKEKYESALKVFEKGLEKADDEFLYWYALTLEAVGNPTAAFLQLKKAEGINPENPLVHKELGKLYRERGNEDESQRHFKLYLQYLKK